MDGFELLHRLRAETKDIQLAVVIWTVKDRTLAEHRQLTSAAQGVLPKGGRSETAKLIAHLPTALPRPVRPTSSSGGDGD